MIYKYTKCESVIAKIMADSDMSEKDMRITDIREWIFEAVEKIGAPMQYIQRESGIEGLPVFKLQDYQIAIPEDLVHLEAVAYSKTGHGKWETAQTNDSQFRNVQPKFISKDKHQPMMYKLPTSQSQFYGQNLVKYLEGAIGSQQDQPVKYFIKPGWIVLNRRDGFIKLSYKAIATDERGYPLIPDLTSYQEAIYWYVMMKLAFPKWLKGSFKTKKAAEGAQYAYTYIQQQWNFYRNQAYAEAMMPTQGDMKAIKNEWNKLLPEWDSDDIFFNNEGNTELTYNDYYYGY